MAPVQESEVFEEKTDAWASDDEGEEMCEKLLKENLKDVDVFKDGCECEDEEREHW